HTTDGVAYYSEEEHLIFVGDIIFAGSVGRSDLPGGNSVKLLNGIREEIFTLPGETVILAGHGPQTTVEQEKNTNPVFNLFDE
ncbi:MAG: MBL fold metallo-hydrolase, partial [Cellulosilyticum sp.]|nr:MBL fold metallo-hydrolase [Cellulosilyticum sp.]